MLAIVAGLASCLTLMLTPLGEEFPAQLAGVLASLAGMLIGSRLPQVVRNQKAPHHAMPHIG